MSFLDLYAYFTHRFNYATPKSICTSSALVVVINDDYKHVYKVQILMIKNETAYVLFIELVLIIMSAYSYQFVK